MIVGHHHICLCSTYIHQFEFGFFLLRWPDSRPHVLYLNGEKTRTFNWNIHDYIFNQIWLQKSIPIQSTINLKPLFSFSLEHIMKMVNWQKNNIQLNLIFIQVIDISWFITEWFEIYDRFVCLTFRFLLFPTDFLGWISNLWLCSIFRRRKKK